MQVNTATIIFEKMIQFIFINNSYFNNFFTKYWSSIEKRNALRDKNYLRIGTGIWQEK